MYYSCNKGHSALGYSTVQTGKIIKFMEEGGRRRSFSISKKVGSILFERHIFKSYKFNILFLIKILSACSAFLPDWSVKGVSRQKVVDSLPPGVCRLRVLSAVGIRGGARILRQQLPNALWGSCSLYSWQTQQCQTEGLYFMFDPSSVVAWPSRGGARRSAGFPLTRPNVYQIRHIKRLIVPLGLDCSLTEPVNKIQWSSRRNKGQAGWHTQAWSVVLQTTDSLWSYRASRLCMFPPVNRKSLWNCQLQCCNYQLQFGLYFPSVHNLLATIL